MNSRFKSASGGPYTTGWINVLFPYIQHQGKYTKNTTVMTWKKGMEDIFGGGPVPADFPCGMSQVLQIFMIEFTFCPDSIQVEISWRRI